MGTVQTRVFCELAVATMPAWLSRQIKDRQLTLCDWGCALGDGTQVLDLAFGVGVIGVDFSHTAVKRAAQRFPQLRFLAEDWSSTAGSRTYDIVFSSNTLEHFAEPWKLFSHLADHARRHVVLLLPYQEHERIEEHEYTFDRATIPLSPRAGWVLADARITDLGRSPVWAGQQVLLVYSRVDELAACGLSEADCFSSRLTQAAPGANPEHQVAEIAELRRQRDAATDQLAELLVAYRGLQSAASVATTSPAAKAPMAKPWWRGLVGRWGR
jgi:SAM-dependent methyltransferase